MITDEEETLFLPLASSSMIPQEDAKDNGMNSKRSNSSDESNDNEPKTNSIPKPKRPLSAYNLFFQSEREKMVRENEKCSSSGTNNADGNNTKKKIGFAPMARTIALKWKNIEPSVREHFDGLAAEDKARYAREKEQWKERIVKMAASSSTQPSLKMNTKRKKKTDTKKSKNDKNTKKTKSFDEDEDSMWNDIDNNANRLQLLLKLQHQQQRQQQQQPVNNNNNSKNKDLMMLFSQQQQQPGLDFNNNKSMSNLNNLGNQNILETPISLLSSPPKGLALEMNQNLQQMMTKNHSDDATTSKDSSSNRTNGESVMSLMMHHHQQQQQQQQRLISQLAAKLDTDCLDFLSNLC